MLRLCFVVLNYNGRNETTELVQNLLSWDRSEIDFRIVIVDNCSTDDSYQELIELFGSSNIIDVIKTERNGGYSYGNNYGTLYAIEKYNPTYIAIANPDIKVDQETVAKLLETFEVNERIAMCAPIMKAIDGSYQIYTQNLPTYVDDLRACYLRNQPSSIKVSDYESLINDNNAVVTEMIPGSFFIIKADVFQDVGMFDDNVFLYCEERIIGKKLKDAGYLSVKRKDLYYVHSHAVTTSKAISEINRWRILLNSRLYYNKVYNNVGLPKRLILKMAMRMYIIQLRILFLIRKRE